MAQHFYSPADIMQETGLCRASVYRYHGLLKSRSLTNPISDSWPLEREHAERLICFIKRRSRKEKLDRR